MKKDIEQQFLQIWNDYHDEIYRYVISMLSDTGEAEECTQDVFLILWKLMQERTMYNPRVWLYKTANLQALYTIQRRTRKQENAFDFDNMEYMLFNEEGFQSLDSGVDTEELYQIILKELTVSERWLLQHYERHTNKGTAEQLNIKSVALRQRYYRLRKKITAILKKALDFMACMAVTI